MKLINDTVSALRMPKELKNRLKAYSDEMKISESKFIRIAILKEIMRLDNSIDIVKTLYEYEN
jgi:predicted DNA-binding protein